MRRPGVATPGRRPWQQQEPDVQPAGRAQHPRERPQFAKPPVHLRHPHRGGERLQERLQHPQHQHRRRDRRDLPPRSRAASRW